MNLPAPTTEHDASRQTWRQHARCADAPDKELFEFPDTTGSGIYRARRARLSEARRYCVRCTVSTDCLSTGTSTRQTGVWGGVLIEHGKPARMSG